MVKLLKIGGPGYVVDEDGYYHEYVCDDNTDIADLPTGAGMEMSQLKPRPGSTAVITDNAAVYMLSNQRAWSKIVEEM